MRILSGLGLLAILAACLPLPGRDAPPAPVEVTLGEPSLQVTVPAHRARTMMRLAGRNGDTETWVSPDGFSISLRDGILVATRGFGFDLIAGDAEATLTALSGVGPEMHARKMRYLGGDNHSTWLAAGCQIEARGSENLDKQRLTLMAERCVARQSHFLNLYWLDGADRIVRSRQWASDQTGYLEIEMISP